MGRRRLITDRIGDRPDRQGAFTVDRFSEGIDDPAQPAVIGVNHRIGVADFDPAAKANALQLAEGHDQGTAVPETDNLANDVAVVAAIDAAMIADRQPFANAADFDQKAGNRRHPAVNLVVRQAVDFGHNIVSGNGQSQSLVRPPGKTRAGGVRPAQSMGVQTLIFGKRERRKRP